MPLENVDVLVVTVMVFASPIYSRAISPSLGSSEVGLNQSSRPARSRMARMTVLWRPVSR